MTGPSPSLGTPMRQPLMITALAAAMAVPATISAQGGAESTAGGRCTVAAGTGPAPSAAVYRLTPSCLRDLRLALNAGEFGRALEIYFGESYNPALANWVVYVKADGSVKQGVIQQNRITELLRSQKYLYAAAFFEAVPTNPADSVNPALELSRRSINFTKDQFTTVLVNAFGAGKIPTFDAGATVADLDRQMNLRLVSDDPASPLWAGSARVEIGENTDVQLSLAANGRQRLPGTLSRLYTTVNNAKASRWDLGLGFATSFGAGAQVTEGSTEKVSASTKTNIYLTTYVNLLAARLPRFRRSYGIVLGTNIANGALLDDIMTGVGVGRVIGDVGLITGVVWEHRLRDETDPVTHLNKSIEYRAPRFFLGFDLRS